MRSVQVVTDMTKPAWPGERAVITIGTYDGVHLGHRAVIEQVRQHAARLGVKSVVITFDPHPASVVRPESAPKLLTSLEQKLELLATTGVDATVVVPFDGTRASESAEEFVMAVLVQVAATRAVVVGEDFHFGRQRQGNVGMLRQIGVRHDFEVFPIELVPRPDGVDEPVSSTSIRRALAGGSVELAHQLLGRPFEVRGPVVKGDQRGRLLGFPTANVEVSTSICMPADGVYAGWYVRPNGDRYACAMNLGRRPTFYEHANVSLLEAHLIDFNDDLYGEAARVQFTHFLRGERKFDGFDAIMAQLKHDVEHARQVLGLR